MKRVLQFKCPRCGRQAYIKGIRPELDRIDFYGICPLCKIDIVLEASWEFLVEKAAKNAQGDDGDGGGENE